MIVFCGLWTRTTRSQSSMTFHDADLLKCQIGYRFKHLVWMGFSEIFKHSEWFICNYFSSVFTTLMFHSCYFYSFLFFLSSTLQTKLTSKPPPFRYTVYTTLRQIMQYGDFWWFGDNGLILSLSTSFHPLPQIFFWAFHVCKRFPTSMNTDVKSVKLKAISHHL